MTLVFLYQVVDAVGSGRKQLHNGKEYDYVFDIDIGDGIPPLKLPYNATGKRHLLFICYVGIYKY